MLTNSIVLWLMALLFGTLYAHLIWIKIFLFDYYLKQFSHKYVVEESSVAPGKWCRHNVLSEYSFKDNYISYNKLKSYTPTVISDFDLL